jgi:hypothetical protein
MWFANGFRLKNVTFDIKIDRSLLEHVFVPFLFPNLPKKRNDMTNLPRDIAASSGRR